MEPPSFLLGLEYNRENKSNRLILNVLKLIMTKLPDVTTMTKNNEVRNYFILNNKNPPDDYI